MIIVFIILGALNVCLMIGVIELSNKIDMLHGHSCKRIDKLHSRFDSEIHEINKFIKILKSHLHIRIDRGPEYVVTKKIPNGKKS